MNTDPTPLNPEPMWRSPIGPTNLKVGVDIDDVIITDRAQPPGVEIIGGFRRNVTGSAVSTEADAEIQGFWNACCDLARRASDAYGRSEEARTYGRQTLAVVNTRLEINPRRMRRHRRHERVVVLKGEATMARLLDRQEPGQDILSRRDLDYSAPLIGREMVAVYRRAFEILPFDIMLHLDDAERLILAAVDGDLFGMYTFDDLREELLEPPSLRGQSFMLAMESSSSGAPPNRFRYVGFAKVTYAEQTASLCFCVPDRAETNLGTGTQALAGLTQLALQKADVVTLEVPHGSSLREIAARSGYVEGVGAEKSTTFVRLPDFHDQFNVE